MKADSEFLFAYGTLRREFAHPMGEQLREGAEFLGMARFQGRMFDIGFYPGVVDSNDESDVVVGELYRLNNPMRILERLDRYEGCGPDDAGPPEFMRAIRPVHRENGERVEEAWIYLFNWPSKLRHRILPGDYAQYCGRDIIDG